MDSVVHLIGKGYNLVTGESMVEDVFEYETVRNDFGILVPATAKSSANKSAQGTHSHRTSVKIWYHVSFGTPQTRQQLSL